jgi:GDSL-like Lipase/Acylhydrolase family
MTAIVFVALTSPIPAHAAAPRPGRSYVALGDSYAAGYGIGTSTGRPVRGCDQSSQDYPHLVAAKLGLNLTDVTCAGATTANLDQVPQRTDAGAPPLQDAALNQLTSLVTLTIGGNDLGFASIASQCAAWSSSGPLVFHAGISCRQAYVRDGIDSLRRTSDDVVRPALARDLQDIHRRAPQATVVVVGYPAISSGRRTAPASSRGPRSCYSNPLSSNSFPFTAVDTVYLEQAERHLDATLRAAATTAGDGFVDTFSRSLSHSACAGTPTPWMNGITVEFRGGPRLAAGSLHPNLAGETAIADAVIPVAKRSWSPVAAARVRTSAYHQAWWWVIGCVLGVSTMGAFGTRRLRRAR